MLCGVNGSTDYRKAATLLRISAAGVMLAAVVLFFYILLQGESSPVAPGWQALAVGVSIATSGLIIMAVVDHIPGVRRIVPEKYLLWLGAGSLAAMVAYTISEQVPRYSDWAVPAVILAATAPGAFLIFLSRPLDDWKTKQVFASFANVLMVCVVIEAAHSRDRFLDLSSAASSTDIAVLVLRTSLPSFAFIAVLATAARRNWRESGLTLWQPVTVLFLSLLLAIVVLNVWSPEGGLFALPWYVSLSLVATGVGTCLFGLLMVGSLNEDWARRAGIVVITMGIAAAFGLARAGENDRIMAFLLFAALPGARGLLLIALSYALNSRRAEDFEAPPIGAATGQP